MSCHISFQKPPRCLTIFCSSVSWQSEFGSHLSRQQLWRSVGHAHCDRVGVHSQNVLLKKHQDLVILQSPAKAQHEADDTSSAKKPRVVWSVEMHQQFVNAVNSLGIDSNFLHLTRPVLSALHGSLHAHASSCDLIV